MSLCWDDERPPFSFVVVAGVARTSTDLDDLLTWATRIAGRYMGADRADEYGRRNAVPPEMVVRVTRPGSLPKRCGHLGRFVEFWDLVRRKRQATTEGGLEMGSWQSSSTPWPLAQASLAMNTCRQSLLGPKGSNRWRSSGGQGSLPTAKAAPYHGTLSLFTL